MGSVALQMAQRGLITTPCSVRETYGMLQPGDTFTLLDMGGVFVLSQRRSEKSVLAEQIAKG